MALIEVALGGAEKSLANKVYETYCYNQSRSGIWHVECN